MRRLFEDYKKKLGLTWYSTQWRPFRFYLSKKRETLKHWKIVCFTSLEFYELYSIFNHFTFPFSVVYYTAGALGDDTIKKRLCSRLHFPGIFCARYSGQEPSRGTRANISCDSSRWCSNYFSQAKCNITLTFVGTQQLTYSQCMGLHSSVGRALQC